MTPSPGTHKGLALASAVVLLTACDAFGQRPRAGRPGAQTSFGSETPVRRPVALPKDVVGRLLEFEDGRLKQCLAENGEAVADVPKHFAASEVDVNGDGARDLVVQAR